MIIEKYAAGAEKNAAFEAISEMMDGFDTGRSYADMMRHRISGAAADECNDIYYVAHEGGRGVSRHWMGFGRHDDAIGNWGNFYTVPESRGKGIGGKLLDFWYKDFKETEPKPLCFLCTAGSVELTRLYSRFGFRPAISGRNFGPLYMPVGDSPASFKDFCDAYYKPSSALIHRPASIGYRHEIDCLLRFYFVENGLGFGLRGITCMDEGILYHRERTGMLFSLDGHCVGWSFDGKIITHPLYKDSDILEERV